MYKIRQGYFKYMIDYYSKDLQKLILDARMARYKVARSPDQKIYFIRPNCIEPNFMIKTKSMKFDGGYFISKYDKSNKITTIKDCRKALNLDDV